MKTLGQWIGNGLPIVKPEIAEERANICRGCPKRQLDSGVLTDAAFQALVSIFNRVKNTRLKSDTLGRCGVCKCALDVKVWMDGELNAEQYKFPDWCWVK